MVRSRVLAQRPEQATDQSLLQLLDQPVAPPPLDAPLQADEHRVRPNSASSYAPRHVNGFQPIDPPAPASEDPESRSATPSFGQADASQSISRMTMLSGYLPPKSGSDARERFLRIQREKDGPQTGLQFISVADVAEAPQGTMVGPNIPLLAALY